MNHEIFKDIGINSATTMYAITFALHVNNKPLAIDQKYIERIRLTRDIDSLSCVSQMVVFFFLNEHKMPCDVTRDTVVLGKKGGYLS